MGRLHRLALERSAQAEAAGALIPLSTTPLEEAMGPPFQLRRLVSRTPKHLRAGGPKPNPFLPWERALEIEQLDQSHVVLLNKFPVQRGHLLLISQQWQPQSGWIDASDWQAVAYMDGDTPGLWFFNSCAAAGASQPHRHLQLLPRAATEASCPLAEAIEQQLQEGLNCWPWHYRISRRHAHGRSDAAEELASLYHQHLHSLGLGQPQADPAPRQPYNLLFDARWFMTVQRRQEHWAGFSVNALGFGGYLLVTEGSDEAWLRTHGPLELLSAVAAPIP
jgi:sulfate adenylyltransferase (ADP) / ATP adenylyltransferase